MSGRRTSSRLKALRRSSLKSAESTVKYPAKSTPYTHPRRKCESRGPKGKPKKKPTDTERPQLVEIIENTPGCRSGSEVMLDVLVMTIEGATVILTSDRDNKSVNVLYRERGEERTRILPTSQFLTNFAVIEDNLVAAGVWSHFKIVFFKVFPDLDLKRTIDTKTRYSSIAFLSPETFVGSHFLRNGVDVFDMSGNILRTFDRSHCNEPNSVCTYNGNCIVGDYSKHAIMCFNDVGNLLFKFKPRADKKFVGLLTVRAHGGYIYASDREGHRVVQWTADGKFVRDVLTGEDGIVEPQGICITDDNLLYVSVKKSYIRVYRIG